MDADAAQQQSQVQLRYRKLGDSMPVGVWIATQDGTLVAKNRQADLIWHGDAPLGAPVGEYTEYVAWDTQTGKQLLPEEYPMARALFGGGSLAPYELRIRRFDGSEGKVLASAVALCDGQGAVIGAVGINVDISEREQLLAQLRRQEQLAALAGALAGALGRG